ncbi:MAG: hypothetical protein WCI88_13525 [Chloroflexota bacterium]
MKYVSCFTLFLTALFLVACSHAKANDQPLKDEMDLSLALKKAAPSSSLTMEPVQKETSNPSKTGGNYLASLPGLSPSEVVSLIEGYGFDCTLPELNNKRTTQYCDLTTDEYQFTVSIWGKTAESVDLIEAVAFYYGELEDYSDLTAVIFGNIGGLSYQNSVTQKAKTWVQETIPSVQNSGDEAINIFGGVHYYIYAMPSIQVLEIGKLQK